jgi:hypothetical protein
MGLTLLIVLVTFLVGGLPRALRARLLPMGDEKHR